MTRPGARRASGPGRRPSLPRSVATPGRGLRRASNNAGARCGFALPLHTEEERPGRVLDRFDGPVDWSGHGRRAEADPILVIVVGTAGWTSLWRRARLRQDPVAGEGPRRRIVILVSIWQVLDERARLRTCMPLQTASAGRPTRSGHEQQRQLAVRLGPVGAVGIDDGAVSRSGPGAISRAAREAHMQTAEEGVERGVVLDGRMTGLARSLTTPSRTRPGPATRARRRASSVVGGDADDPVPRRDSAWITAASRRRRG